MARHGHKPTRRSGIGTGISRAAKSGSPLKKKTSKIARLRFPK